MVKENDRSCCKLKNEKWVDAFSGYWAVVGDPRWYKLCLGTGRAAPSCRRLAGP
jgi:hypothetical protein